MLYIFDLGNVIIDIDFQRVLQVWSQHSGVPVATLQARFTHDAAFCEHERGTLSDAEFAGAVNRVLGMQLSFAQFAEGWQAIFGALRMPVIERMQQLRAAGETVGVLSNTNALHCELWPSLYPQVAHSADRVYLSNEMGWRKPQPQIYQQVLADTGFTPAQSCFFDDNADNIAAARALGIESVWVKDAQTVLEYFRQRDLGA